MKNTFIRNCRWLVALLVMILALPISVFALEEVQQEENLHEVDVVRTRVYAQAADDYIVDEDLVQQVGAIPHRVGETDRANVANAFGPPDSPQGAPNDTFTSLAYFPGGVSYFFGLCDSPDQHIEIFRCPFRQERNPDLDGKDGEDDADISLVEVTWGNWWHEESVEVYLIDPTFVEGMEPHSSLFEYDGNYRYYLIGTAYNIRAAQRDFSRGIMFISGQEDFQRFHRDGDITRTDIFFPDHIVSAFGVRLINNIYDNVPDNGVSRPCDGYDLDAMIAWFVDAETPPQPLSFPKYIDLGGELQHPPDDNEFSWNIYDEGGAKVAGPLFTTWGTHGRVDIPVNILGSLPPGEYFVREAPLPNWVDRTGQLTFKITEAGQWEWMDGGYEEYVNEFVPTPILLSDLSWNNGNGNGNGGGINAFTFNGVGFRNNRNFLTPQNFEEAIQNQRGAESAIYTVVERIVSEDNGYQKVHVIRIALRDGNYWRLYEGTIIVDNPGGNNNRQQISVFPVVPFTLN